MLQRESPNRGILRPRVSREVAIWARKFNERCQSREISLVVAGRCPPGLREWQGGGWRENAAQAPIGSAAVGYSTFLERRNAAFTSKYFRAKPGSRIKDQN